MQEPKPFSQGTKPLESCPVCGQPLNVCLAIDSVERDPTTGELLSVKLKPGVAHNARRGPEGRKLFQD